MRVPASAARCGLPRKAQDAGRGRRGNTWVSPPGNLYATLLLTEPSTKAVAPQLSFVAALALHDALCECAPQLGPSLKVKWPNDLLLGPAKLAGILIEGESEPAFAVAIGIGVNCASHPEGTAFPATDLAAAGALVAPEALFAALARAMGRGLRSGTRAMALPQSAPTGSSARRASGSRSTCGLPERELAGRFHGLDEAGPSATRTAGRR